MDGAISGGLSSDSTSTANKSVELPLKQVEIHFHAQPPARSECSAGVEVTGTQTSHSGRPNGFPLIRKLCSSQILHKNPSPK